MIHMGQDCWRKKPQVPWTHTLRTVYFQAEVFLLHRGYKNQANRKVTWARLEQQEEKLCAQVPSSCPSSGGRHGPQDTATPAIITSVTL